MTPSRTASPAEEVEAVIARLGLVNPEVGTAAAPAQEGAHRSFPVKPTEGQALLAGGATTGVPALPTRLAGEMFRLVVRTPNTARAAAGA